MAGASSKADAVLRILDRAYPDARCALHFRKPFELLVATILSAQCTDEQVNRVTPSLFQKYPSPRALAAADREDLERAVHSCGFYRNKARHIQEACRALVERHGGEVPSELEALLRLPGIGRKTANIIRNDGFGLPAIAVDTHVLRVSNRLGWARGEDPDKVEFQLAGVVPRRWWPKFDHLLTAHGRRCCGARKPNCRACPVLRHCPYEDKHGV